MKRGCDMRLVEAIADALAMLGVVLTIGQLLMFVAIVQAELDLSNVIVALDEVWAQLPAAVATVLIGPGPFGPSFATALLSIGLLVSRVLRRTDDMHAWQRVVLALCVFPGAWAAVVASMWGLSPGGIDLSTGRLDVEFVTEGHLRELGHALLCLAIGINLALRSTRPRSACRATEGP